MRIVHYGFLGVSHSLLEPRAPFVIIGSFYSESEAHSPLFNLTVTLDPHTHLQVHRLALRQVTFLAPSQPNELSKPFILSNTFAPEKTNQTFFVGPLYRYIFENGSWKRFHSRWWSASVSRRRKWLRVISRVGKRSRTTFISFIDLSGESNDKRVLGDVMAAISLRFFRVEPINSLTVTKLSEDHRQHARNYCQVLFNRDLVFQPCIIIR